MSRIDDLIANLCPDGVPFEPIHSVVNRGETIRWSDAADESFQYIDLTSVDRVTHAVVATQMITSENAPSRAQQIVRDGDVIFGTTRPMLKRYAVITAAYDGQIASTGYCVLRPKSDRILSNYLFHFLGTANFYAFIEANERGASYPAIPDDVVKQFRIPVPPLDVQREIVRILDTFGELEAELEAEVALRNKQYVHYRQILLGLKDDDSRERWLAIGDLGRWYSGATPSKGEPRYWESGDIPWLAPMDVSETGDVIRGRVTHAAVEETSLRLIPPPTVVVVMRSNILRRRLPIGLVTRATTINQDVRALVPREDVDADYVYQALRAASEEIRATCVRTDGSMAAVDSRSFFAQRVPLPPIQEQRAISAKLRNFDALVNDLSIGLPAELAARRKQYEYYRDRLLTFQECSA